MAAKSEVTIRYYQIEDNVRCLTIFTEGMRGLINSAMKTVYPDFFKAAVVFLVPIIVIAMKCSLWILLVPYLVAFGLIATVIYLYIHAVYTTYINGCLKSDLLDIGEYYKGDSCMFVAENDGRVIGMVGVVKKDHHKPGVAELKRMSVCPSVRRKGIGTLLVNKAVEYCKQKKYDKIILNTSSSHHDAVALYKRYGFKVVNIESFPNCFLYNAKILFFEKDI